MAEMTQEELEKMTPEQIAELQKKNCIFCKIISGEIPSKKVYDDKDFTGILDINPATEGHILLMPKQHIQVLPQMNPELVGKLGIACRNVSQRVLKASGAAGTTIFLANGAVAGQKAPHLLVHIIPRKENDDLPLNPTFKELPFTEYESTKKAIMTALGVAPQEITQSQSLEEPSNETISDSDTEETTVQSEPKKKKSSDKKQQTTKKAQKKEDKGEPEEEIEADIDMIAKYLAGQ